MNTKTKPNRTLLVAGASERLGRSVVGLRLETRTGGCLVATRMSEVSQ